MQKSWGVTPHDHLRPRNCPKYGNESKSVKTSKNKKFSKDIFIDILNLIKLPPKFKSSRYEI